MKLSFVKGKETKGTVRFEEEGNKQAIGTLYVRKHVLPDPFPERVEVELTWTGAN